MCGRGSESCITQIVRSFGRRLASSPFVKPNVHGWFMKLSDFANCSTRSTSGWNPMPSIETQRLVLRPIAADDADQLFALFAKQSGAGPNVGYWLGEPHWGKGYMTEAVNALVHHIFATSDAHAIYLGAFTANASSLRVQTKVGFVSDGETKLHSNPQNVEFAHINTMLTRGAFEASNRRNPLP